MTAFKQPLAGRLERRVEIVGTTASVLGHAALVVVGHHVVEQVAHGLLALAELLGPLALIRSRPRPTPPQALGPR